MRLIRPTALLRLLVTLSFIIFHLSFSVAQIKIGGNVYGGGNHGNVNGSANVRVCAGDINKVFGGARMANVGGSAYVNIDGAHATGYSVINYVYGGNDVAGTIGTAAAVGETLPTELAGNTDGVDNTWNSYVHLSTKTPSAAVYYTAEEADAYNTEHNLREGDEGYKTTSSIKTPAVTQEKCFIGQLFAGGNGNFTYTDEDGNPLKDDSGNYIATEEQKINGIPTTITVAINTTPFIMPDLDKTYLDIQGGTIVFAHGGGNNVTAREKAVIHVNNPSEVVTDIKVNTTTGLEDDESGESILTDDRIKNDMGIRMAQEHVGSDEFQIDRMFGGNNKAEMAIRPTWNLESGKIRNLYSGGNRGNMTSPEGLLLEIPTTSTVKVDNVYGGCRMADVCPTVNGVYTPCSNLTGYNFPKELSARVLIRGGDINNVYGGNDVTGTVYGGNAIGVYKTIRGDVYGAGNGGYAYTDVETMEDDETYGDFYYSTSGFETSVDALNAFRPNAEQVSIHLAGTSQREPTIIKGSIFVGGNCASLATTKNNPMVELKIGSHVIADKVFLGNNGAKMVDEDILALYADNSYSSLTLTDKTEFANYMEGVAMNLQPAVVFDAIANGDPANYTDYTSYVGSFYCGGNVGSMAIAGNNRYSISRGLNIFEKFVGGCNNADVEEKWTGENHTGTQLCAAYEGGVLGARNERGTSVSSFYTETGAENGKIKDRLEINLENMTITPLRWDADQTRLIWNTNRWGDVYSAVKNGTTLTTGQTYYTSDRGDGEFTSNGTEVADGKNYFVKDDEQDFYPVPNSPVDSRNRLLGGNIYGGCFNSGHVNGNVVININDDVLKRDEVFGNEMGPYGNRASGVDLYKQRDDLNAVALILFGAGCGKNTEIWGSTTVNHNNGYVFQICGGGEEGVVGRKREVRDEYGEVIDHEYYFDPRYSSTVNLNGATPIYSSDGTVEDLAETEYIYGGGKEGDVCGNTLVNLGNGRIYDAFAGASEANVLGHSELYIGRQPKGDGTYKDGFPWIMDNVYGGNDFSGTVFGEYEDDYNFEARLRNYDADKTLIHGYKAGKIPDVMKSASYIEYLQGRVDTIFGGNYGYYDYKVEYDGCEMPYLSSSFVNIRPKLNGHNHITGIFGGGTGYPKNRDGDKSQDRSYVLIDIPKNGDKDVEYFKNIEVFGAGSYDGLGMRLSKSTTFIDSFDPDQLSAIVDLLHGKIKSVYGGSFNEGVTARTVINVPATSTIHIDSIFGGAYGTQILPPCDVFESNVNYGSNDATLTGAIYGGNNNERRTLYAKINVTSPVWKNKEKGYLSTVYGAGHGIDTWSEYTEVNLLPKPKDVAGDYTGARVYEVYGGGEMGHVLNAESVQKYMQLYQSKPSAQISKQDPNWSKADHWTGEVGTSSVASAYTDQWAKDWADAWTLGDYFTPYVDSNDDGKPDSYDYTKYATNAWTNLTNETLVTHDADMDDRDYSAYKYADGDNDAAKAAKDAAKKRIYKRYNTNVRIHEGATVEGYAYGGGLGDSKVGLTGDVYGTTYIGLLGGTVLKDIYAAGTTGAVYDLFGVGAYNASSNPIGFTASANAYIKGGSCRNVYGGGWKGDVGHHEGAFSASPATDMLGETHVVIGDVDGSSFTSGIPTVQRNAYGGGEGGAVYGTAYLTMNKGYVGYQYNADSKKYEEKIEDDTKASPNTFLQDAGCLFGGGYIDNSTVDKTHVKLYGGYVRGSVFGGGEIAAIGRGSMSKSPSTGRTSLEGIYRPGKTLIEMYGGEVHRNVYGGGRGSDNLGGHGSLYCDGYVFGQTEVNIYGGEVGTVSGVADGNGNVFAGGDEGHVYSAYEIDNTNFGIGKKDGVRYDELYQGYYYKYENGDFVTEDIGGGKTERQFTEDCKVLVEPHLKVLAAVTINGHDYKVGDYVPTKDLNTLKNKDADYRWEYLDPKGIIIHNAVFAGGNAPSGSLTTSANTASVFGNATASVNDIYHRDMITLGTRHTGGLYGDGNLTLVDGYRELNITNYGTDYYSIAKQIGIEAYHALPDREADYYELRYTCKKNCTDKDGTLYKIATTDANGFTTKASTITADEMQSLFVTEKNGEKVSVTDGENGPAILKYDTETGEWVPNPDLAEPYWEESGVLPVYAGRLMNSIQRADFCGVFGSRMVMQGAQDRVPEEVDYTNYTINRVREVSLNKVESVITDDASDPQKKQHGNYFGIYNIVNYLGALTSDVDFGDEDANTIDATTGELKYAVRTTDNSDHTTYQADIKIGDNTYEYGNKDYTFYNWKKAFHNERKRNNGNSHNKVALASGVYLEITTEESTGDGLYEKVWGPITGVIELDLINVSTGIGGGFVYAKNQHGVRSKSGLKNTTLTKLNNKAVTQWDFTYTTSDETKKEFETSGNFVHSTQTIIDDCYNVSNRYLGDVKEDGTGAMPAHYWFIKGTTYVYDQYISAYTGISNAFSETVDIPLTIAAASHGTMKLLNVQPNLYAYYSSPGVKLGDGKKVIINDKTYYKNDPISYWDWYLLSKSEKDLFVAKTYTNCVAVNIDDEEENGEKKIYEAGTYVMTAEEFTNFGTHTYKNAEGEVIKDSEKNVADNTYIFRESNNVSHNTGYILTYEVNNPSKWDNWYTPKKNSDGDKIMLADYEALPLVTSDSKLGKDAYYDGPTFRLKSDITEGILLGQQSYSEGQLIAKSIYDTYTSLGSAIPNYGLTKEDPQYDANLEQAVFEEAYIVKNEFTATIGSSEHHYNVGATVPKTIADANSSYVEVAYICTNSVQVSKDEMIYKDTRMTKTAADKYVTDVTGKMNTIKTGTGAMTMDEIKALTPAGDFTDEKKKELINLATLRDELKANLVPAYYCSANGLYGGTLFESGKNYRGLEAWSSLSAADHAKFDYNYDALDLLIDPKYQNAEGKKFQYDGNYTSEAQVNDATNGNKAGYSVTQSVDYTATYNSASNLDLGTDVVTVKRSDKSTSTSVIQKDDELTREVYESLPNEQRHYSPIAVKENGTYYVVNTSFQIGSTPYAVGEVISSESYNSLPSDEQGYVTQLTFTGITSENAQTYYYCRDSYKVESGGSSVTNAANVTAMNGSTACTVTGTYNANDSVPLGLVIPATTYNGLKNQQKNFTIHGISPTETSTLFVSRESNIYDLSKEKIITVIYQYDYDETDGTGNVTPISERHVVNIHLNFKSGVPTVEDIQTPDIILPGDFTILREPTVTPGAYEVTGGGWELFESQRDAESHSNGVEFTPSFDPLYWYQDGYYVAYYAKSYLGRTYSNFVPVSVANYHDLADVMSDANKEHHMYIDNKNVKREPKIYINDYSGSGKDGLDHFKNLYDLSVLDGSPVEGYTFADGKITAATGSANTALVGHALLSNQTRAERNLEFFLRTDIKHTDSWTSIGYNGVCDDPATENVDEALSGETKGACFDGVFHGDGHTISGLDHSLFNYLCGEVYNLGVTGSFTGGGIAETGNGYVESCWINTTGIPDDNKYAVFGNPTATESDAKQIVNSYYQDTKEYKTTANDHGVATPKPDRAFYNGEVAYDLNNFYLYKRYSDKRVNSGLAYKYWKSGQAEPQTGYYASNASLCSSGYNNIKYVEDRFKDGDFRYDGGTKGTIPDTEDERHWVETVTTGSTTTEEDRWSPIWPDDYIFFGQKLTYGYATESHQDVPTAVVRDGGRISDEADANRVYRAPAYYQSKLMGVAHFNPQAYLAQKSSDGTKEAYPHMTAIDFAGHNDTKWGTGVVSEGFPAESPAFYPPLLDDDGLTGIENCDETRNLLVYAPAATAVSGYANKKTFDVLTSYFADPAYTNYYDNSYGYRLVDVCISPVYGHLVQNNLKATNDHLLVDKEDFNAPIAYSFDSSHRMWYQRKPADKEFVDRTKGWQGISIPFDAELVTTNDKGEITHFYSGSETSKNGTGTKIGHEYWLREFKNITEETVNEKTVAKGTFDYPTATGSNKTVTNHFLWDYYYKQFDRKDHNSDTYQEYYSGDRTHTSYPLLARTKPYIIGFPGQTYYEFDLSGKFEAQNTFEKIGKLLKQTITFASNTGIGIGVSDDEMTGTKVTYNSKDYYFKPNYMNISLNNNDYAMNSDGSAFIKLNNAHYAYVTSGAKYTFADEEKFNTEVTANGKLYTDEDGNTEATWSHYNSHSGDTYYRRTGETTVNDHNHVTPALSAFRPFFTVSTSSSRRLMPEQIVFNSVSDEFGEDYKEDSGDGALIIKSRPRHIIVKSTLKTPKEVTIHNANGIRITTFIIQPGQTIETLINMPGFYIVNKTKLAVR